MKVNRRLKIIAIVLLALPLIVLAIYSAIFVIIENFYSKPSNVFIEPDARGANDQLEQQAYSSAVVIPALLESETQCVGEGTLRAQRINGGWSQSSPLWVDGEPVKCVGGKALVKGKPISNEALSDLATRTLSADFDEKHTTRVATVWGSIDVASVEQVIREAKALCAGSAGEKDQEALKQCAELRELIGDKYED